MVHRLLVVQGRSWGFILFFSSEPPGFFWFTPYSAEVLVCPKQFCTSTLVRVAGGGKS